MIRKSQLSDNFASGFLWKFDKQLVYVGSIVGHPLVSAQQKCIEKQPYELYRPALSGIN